jgi:transcriptional regulator with XRE-family HTH domain
MNTNDLAKKIKEVRALRGMSQEFLAEEARVSLRTIQRAENNESTPTGETIKRIAVALAIDLNELLGVHSALETSDLTATIIFLKKQLSKTNEKAEIKTFENFIQILNSLKEKDLNTMQTEGILNYINYLELDKIPSFNNEIFKSKLEQFKKYLKVKVRFVPNNYYTTWIASFVISFTAAFLVQKNIAIPIKIGVVISASLFICVGMYIDLRIKRAGRAFNF